MKNKETEMTTTMKTHSKAEVGAKELDATDFSIVIDEMVYQKVMRWVLKAKTEVSGFGTASFDKETRTFHVTDAYLIAQSNTSASTELDSTDLGRVTFQKRGVEGAFKWHWHSHPKMGVFWSGQDKETIRGLGHQGWIIATVFNDKYESRSAFCSVTEVMGNKHEIFVDEIDLEISQPEISDEITRAWDAEFDAKVKERSFGTRQTLWPDDEWPTHHTPQPYLGGRSQSQIEHDRAVEQQLQQSLPGVAYSRDEHDGWPDDGWKYDHVLRRELYNPLRDKSGYMADPSVIFEEVMHLDVDEFERLKEIDPKFKTYTELYDIQDKEIKEWNRK